MLPDQRLMLMPMWCQCDDDCESKYINWCPQFTRGEGRVEGEQGQVGCTGQSDRHLGGESGGENNSMRMMLWPNHFTHSWIQYNAPISWIEFLVPVDLDSVDCSCRWKRSPRSETPLHQCNLCQPVFLSPANSLSILARKIILNPLCYPPTHPPTLLFMCCTGFYLC